ncbi:hypothetical protein ACFL41_00315 [Gemmatimonadota bacterium]
MPAAINPRLTSGMVYRTSDLSKWTTNPSRTADRLVREGELVYLAKGLYYRPRLSRFGQLPPDHKKLLRAFLKNDQFLITGPVLWAELGLGATAAFAHTLVYNTRRSGYFDLGGRKYYLRRIPFPTDPTTEWFVIDLIEHHDMAGISLEEISENLIDALRNNRFDRGLLTRMGARYGKERTRRILEEAITASEVES